MAKDDITIASLRALAAVCDNDLNVTAAADALNTTQPSVSKKLLALEKRIGRPLFLRNGRRLQHETDLCRRVAEMARGALLQCDNILALAESAENKSAGGELAIGTTHTQARYVLPPVLEEFRRDYPNVSVCITQGAPAELARLLNGDRVDMVICTESLDSNSAFRALPLLRWNRCLVAPPSHPLVAERKLTLKKLAAYPIVTYVNGFTGRNSFDKAFARVGLTPTIAVSAADADVIKAYARAGFGYGVIAEMAHHPDHDADLAKRSLDGLFPSMRVYLAYQRKKFVSASMERFIELLRARMRGGAAD